MAKRGRKRIEIDYEEFEKLCSIQCTLDEVAEWFKVSPDTIERRIKEFYGINFADAFKKYSSKGKISLRRNQFALSRTNAAMAIWLGKQYLNQKDKFEEETKDIDINIKFDE